MNDEGETWAGLPVVRKLDQVVARSRVIIEGTITAAGPSRLQGSRAYLVRIDDGHGKITLAFTGRSEVPGLVVGTSLRVTGTARLIEAGLFVFNPDYEILAPPMGQDPFL